MGALNVGLFACSSPGHPASAGPNSTDLPAATAQSSFVAATDAATYAAATPSVSANPSDVAFADNAAASAFASMDAPALYVGIWDPQRGSFVRAYGRAVRDGANATTQDSLRVASITKTFTATVVLELVQEGKVDLGAPVTNYLGQPLALEPKLTDVTVEQLLGMQSGLSDYLTDPKGIAAQIAADPARVWRPQELAAAALKLDEQLPGTRGYTNTNFVLLGLLAENVSGTSLASLIQARLSEPLGLAHTFLPAADDTSLPDPAAHGYLNQQCLDKVRAAGAANIDPQTDTTDWSTSYFYGAGGMISTIDDLGAWAATDLGTSLLAAAVGRRRLDVHDIGGDGFLYGLGIKRFGDWYGHDGDAFGWDSIALHDPTTGVSFVAAVNACTGFNGAFLDLLQTLYPDTSTRSQ